MLARVRREAGRNEGDAGQFEFAQRSGERHAVAPRRADTFERRVGAAADREVGAFEQADAWIQQRLREASHVGGRIGPQQARAVEAVLARPAFARDDARIDADAAFALEHAHQLARSHAVAQRSAMPTHERLGSGVEERAAHRHAIDRVGAVEHDESHAVLGARFHAVPHRRDIGVEAATDVLDVEHDRVDALQHLLRRLACLAVERPDRQARRVVLAVADAFLVELALQSVLGREDRDELDGRKVRKDVDRATAVRGEAGVVRHEADLAAFELLAVVAREHVDAAEHGGALRKQRSGEQDRGEKAVHRVHARRGRM